MSSSAQSVGSRSATSELAGRIKEVRGDRYGPDGVPILAEALKLPAQTWSNYEMGVVVPSLVILKFIDVTGANPLWLLRGQGDRFLER
jgi:hypothetical protein